MPDFDVDEARAQRNVELWMEVAKKYITEDEYDFIRQVRGKAGSGRESEITSEEWNRVFVISQKANEPIYTEFVEPDITAEEKELFYPMFSGKAFPDIAAVAEAFCRELLTPVPIRDQSIDVTGVR